MVNHVDRSCNEGLDLTTKRLANFMIVFLYVFMCDIGPTSTILAGPRRETTKVSSKFYVMPLDQVHERNNAKVKETGGASLDD